MAKKKKLKIIPLGGLHEIGKNMTLLEYDNDILIIDCGMSFPTDEMYGIDVVIPDFSYLEKNSNKIKGLIVTHAHEDHIGGIPYLLSKFKMPIYASKLSIGFIKRKLEERKVSKPKLHEIAAGEKIKLGCFKIEAIATTHSIPDSFAFAIGTPVGTVLHTGDFKIDYTPVDTNKINLTRFTELGTEGVQLLLSDSTNADKYGFTASETSIGETLNNLFYAADGRIIISTFSSHVHRVQQIIDAAVSCNRKVAISGRSMEQMLDIAVDLGYLNIPANTLIKVNKIKNYPDSELVIITTGSQGEPLSALYRMASGEHKDVKVRPGDTIIFSASPIPGNEKAVSKVINELIELGADVITNDIFDTHTSGHACREELKLVQYLVKPKFFMPVHGEAMHLKAHADIAINLGQKPSHVICANNGDVIELSENKIKLSDEKVSAETIMVDGLGVGDVGFAVLNERKNLAESGCLVIAVTLDSITGEILNGPSISTRGLTYVKEYGKLIEEAEDFAEDLILQTNRKVKKDQNAMKKLLRDKLRKYIYDKIERSPLIISMIMYI